MFQATVRIDVKAMSDLIRKTTEEAADLLAERGREIFQEDVMGTWETSYPVEIRRLSRYRRDVVVVGDVPFWLNDGTSINYAVMTNDFIPKTNPNALRSGAGRGGFSHLTFPFGGPGIEARNFDQSVAEQLLIEAPTILQRR